jgi:hypothetical protein
VIHNFQGFLVANQNFQDLSPVFFSILVSLMSDKSSPEVPVRRSLPNSPQSHTGFHSAAHSPHTVFPSHPLISPLNSPNPNIFVVDNTNRCSLPPLSPIPDNSGQRGIPSPLLSPHRDPPPLHSCNKDGVSSLFSGLQFTNQLVEQTFLSHAQLVANLETLARRHEKLIKQHDSTIKVLRQLLVLASDFAKVKEQYPRDLLQLRSSVDSVTNPILLRLSQLEQCPTSTPAARVFPEPPFYSHIYFSGDITKTHRFCSLMRDSFACLCTHFSSKRQKILWILGYFRTPKGHLGDSCHSYSWWRGLLT